MSYTGRQMEGLDHYSEVALLASERGNDLFAMYTLFTTLHVDDDMTRNFGVVQLYLKNCRDYELLSTTLNMEFREKFCIRFLRLVYSLSTFPSFEAFHEVWPSVANSIEEFLISKSTTEVDVLRIISILIFVVHLHKRMPVQPGSHFVQLQTYGVFVTFEFAAHLLRICASVKNVFSTPLLPALHAFVEWYVYSPDMIIENVESTTSASVVINQDERQWISRAIQIFGGFCQNFLESTLSGQNMQGQDGILISYINKNKLVNSVSLWEDRVLQGYAPFDPVRRALKLSGVLSSGSDENKNRMARIVDAVQKAVQSCETSQLQGDPKDKKVVKVG